MLQPTDCVYYLISRATLVTTSALKRELAAAGVGRVRPAYLGVLLCLWHEDGLQASELGRRAGLEPSTITGLLDRMDRDGLLERRPDPNDRRAQRIHLTPSGVEVKKPVLATVDSTLSSLTRDLDENDIETVKRSLMKVLSNAQEQRQ